MKNTNIFLNEYEYKIVIKILEEFLYFSEQELDLGIYSNEIDLDELKKLISKLK